MAKKTYVSEVKWSGEGVLSVAHTNGKQLIIDEPKQLGGTDQGPNPVEYVLSALGGCVNVLVVSFAKSFGVQVEEVHVHLGGGVDSYGCCGKSPNVRDRYEDSRYVVDLAYSSPEEIIRALLHHVDQVCAVKDTLQGTTVTLVNKQAIKK